MINATKRILHAVKTMRTASSRLCSYMVHQEQQSYRLSKNPLNQYGATVFSQNEEDGLTLEILHRIGLENGSFAEFGVGNGFENNTMMLAAMKWKGFWAGGEELAFITHTPNPNFLYMRSWITRDNIFLLYKKGCAHLGIEHVDIISMDLDGNDIHFVRELLKNGARPKLFIVEYHARFMPPILFEIDYDARHQWIGDDYFGASFASFCEAFKRYNYMPVCCNERTGTNAFFVHCEYANAFPDIPNDILEIWMPPRYDRGIGNSTSHPQSKKTMEVFFRQLANAPSNNEST